MLVFQFVPKLSFCCYETKYPAVPKPQSGRIITLLVCNGHAAEAIVLRHCYVI